MESGQLNTRPHCPTCNKLLDGFTAVDHKHKPEAGDVTEIDVKPRPMRAGI